MFHPAARLLLSMADICFATPDSGLKLFTWWDQVPDDRTSQRNVIAAAIEGPLKESLKAARGFLERDAGRVVFNIYREPVNGRPCLPPGREPQEGHYFEAAMCVPGADGLPCDTDGNLLTLAPPGAKKYRVESVETHLAAAHWSLEVSLAS